MIKLPDIHLSKRSSELSVSSVSKIASIWIPIVIWIVFSYWSGGWISRFFSPANVDVMNMYSVPPTELAGGIAQRHWFGEMIAPVDSKASSLPNVQVVGVYAAEVNEKENFAIVVLNGQSMPLLMGQEVGNGWTLSKVQANGIELKNAEGETQTINIGGAASSQGNNLNNNNVPDANTYSPGTYPNPNQNQNMPNAGNPNMNMPTPSYTEGNELEETNRNRPNSALRQPPQY